MDNIAIAFRVIFLIFLGFTPLQAKPLFEKVTPDKEAARYAWSLKIRFEYSDSYVKSLGLDPGRKINYCLSRMQEYDDQWRFDYTLETEKHQKYQDFSFSRDSEYCQFLDRKSGLMRISRTERPWMEVHYFNPRTEFFAWAYIPSPSNGMFFLSPSEVLTALKQLPEQRKVTIAGRAKLLNKDADIYEITGGQEEGEAVTYKIWLPAEDRGFPLKCEKYDEKKQLLEKYEILKTIPIPGTTFFLPATALMQKFNGTGALLYTANYETTSLEALKDSLNFGIDPSEATVIEDWDEKSTIHVPK